MKTRLDSFGQYGYYWLVIWEEPWSESQGNFAGKEPTNYFEDDGYAILSQYANRFAGGNTGIPQHALLDKDGKVRKYGLGATDQDPYKTEWDNAIKELLGIS